MRLTSSQIWDTVTGQSVINILEFEGGACVETDAALSTALNNALADDKAVEAVNIVFALGLVEGKKRYCAGLAAAVNESLRWHIGQGQRP